jgi:hypothetical protein
VDARRQPYRPSAEEIISICDRHAGVGADDMPLCASSTRTAAKQRPAATPVVVWVGFS